MVDERVEAIISDHEIEAKRKRRHITLTKLSFLILDDSSFNILYFEAVAFGLLEVNCLLHVFPEVALIILDQDELHVNMAFIEGGKPLYVHLELAAIVELNLLICMLPHLPWYSMLNFLLRK